VGDVQRRPPGSTRPDRGYGRGGDEVVVRWTAEGTRQGELLGSPATGKRLWFSGASIDRLAEGKVAENCELIDQLGLLQLGVIPLPAQGSP
jgi:hypothetical protein